MSVSAEIISRKYLITILMQVVYYCICLSTAQVLNFYQAAFKWKWVMNEKKKNVKIISSLNLKPQF